MFRWIIGSSLKFRFLIVAIAGGMVAFGMDRFQDMPVDVFPEFAPPRVEIQTEGPGLSTEEVEELLTIPLEHVLQATPGVDVMRSKSVPALSSILLIFKPGTDLFHARQLVQERLAVAASALPKMGTIPFILQPLSATSRALKIGLTSKTIDMIDLSTIALWKIRSRLMAVKGVANVAIWGERLHQIQVQVDPKRMQQHKVTVDQVMETTSEALEVGILNYTRSITPGSGGWIETADKRLGVQHVLPVTEPEHLAKVPIKLRENGKPLLLSDVGDVVKGHPPLIGDAVINDGLGLMLIVEKFPWGNTLELTRGVEAALDELRPGLPGIEIDSEIFRPATFIETSIDNLTEALLIGAVLVVFILGAFLFEWRVAVISTLAIPFSLVAAGLVLYVTNATINTMVLAGLIVALGAVVDDAIIDIENIVRRLRQARREGRKVSTAGIILEASLEIRRAIVYATLIIVLAVMPVFFMGGLSGAFFEPLAMSYAIALLASMVVAMTVTPALGLLLLRNAPLEKRESPLVRWLQRGYDAILARIVRTPRTAYVSVGVIVLAGAVVWPLLGQSMLPSFKERDFLMHWLTKPGTSHPEMYRITEKVSPELRAIPGVRNFGAHIGRALAADEVVGMYFTENWVSVDPKADYDTALMAIQDVVDGYPGIYRDVQTYLKERIREVLTGTSEAIVLRIYGPELTKLRETAESVEKALKGIEGIVDLHVDLQTQIPHIQIKVDLEAAGRHGIKPGDVRRMAGAMVASVEVGDIYTYGRAIDVAVWSTPETRDSLTSIHDLPIDSPRGGVIRLGDVAQVRVAPTPNVIEHESTFRRIDVGANVRGRDLGSVVADVEDRLAKVKLPLGYHIERLGEYAERQAAQRRLLIAAAVAAIGIYLLLQAAFGSWRLATLSFLSLPAALVGGVLAAYLGDGVISLGSMVGFLTVLGIAARNGILLIDHCQQLEKREGMAFGPDLVLRGARERLAPILMTAITTGLALMPLVIFGNLPGHEIEHPMAVVIVGGLVTSTLLNLFIVPSLYLRFGGSPKADVFGEAPAAA